MLAYQLAGRGCFAFVNEVTTTKLFGRQADRVCDFIQMTLEREDALRRTKTAERTVWRNISGNRSTLDAHVWTNIWAGCVNCAARKDDGRKRTVCATVDYKLDLHRQE